MKALEVNRTTLHRHPSEGWDPFFNAIALKYPPQP